MQHKILRSSCVVRSLVHRRAYYICAFCRLRMVALTPSATGRTGALVHGVTPTR